MFVLWLCLSLFVPLPRLRVDYCPTLAEFFGNFNQLIKLLELGSDSADIIRGECRVPVKNCPVSPEHHATSLDCQIEPIIRLADE